MLSAFTCECYLEVIPSTKEETIFTFQLAKLRLKVIKVISDNQQWQSKYLYSSLRYSKPPVPNCSSIFEVRFQCTVKYSFYCSVFKYTATLNFWQKLGTARKSINTYWMNTCSTAAFLYDNISLKKFLAAMCRSTF